MEIGNADKPLVVIENELLLPLEKLGIEKERLETVLLESYSPKYARDPRDIPGFGDIETKLEDNKLPTSQIDYEIYEFQDLCETYYRLIAHKEGLVKPGDEMQFRVVYVLDSKMQEIFTEKSKSVGGVPDGWHHILSNTIYVKYPSVVNEYSSFSLMLSLFHEMRHRVYRPLLSVKLSDNGGKIKATLTKHTSPLHLFHKPELETMEEIFVNGYTISHIHEMEHTKLQTSLLKRKEFIKKYADSIPWALPKLAVVLNVSLEEGHMNWNPACVYSNLFLIIKQVVPNFEELCIDIRCGNLNTIEILKHEIEKALGKWFLEGLVTVSMTQPFDHWGLLNRGGQK